MDKDIIDRALAYHRSGRPGKIAVMPIKPMDNRDDLSLAYSPGVAAPCLSIAKDAALAADFTSRSNLVAVISNGTAVLGLGNIGALASKPVMEGKACLFKKFADVDVFDLEIDETDPQMLVKIITRLEPTFGGINLEDIKAPECFVIERLLRERMTIPVFHDDQHGTAIVAAAGVLNALELVGKPIGAVKLVCSGAGAAATACLDILVTLGLDPLKVWVTDSKGVIHSGRDGTMDEHKRRYAKPTDARSLGDIIADADIFLGLSTGGVLTTDMVATMAERPIIFAMANPEPEIRPEHARQVRPDCIIGTGRSDYPNQVNNVLCFPFIFRGALDVGATTINEEMKVAATLAIASLAKESPSDVVARAYEGTLRGFGPDYLLPSAFDPRLLTVVAPAVAEAAVLTGVATRPIADFDAYRASLQAFVYRSAAVMQPIFKAVRTERREDRKRLLFTSTSDARILRAIEMVVEQGFARPVLAGQRDAIVNAIGKASVRLKEGRDYEIVTGNPLALLRSGDVDGLLAGGDHSFAEEFRALNGASLGEGPLAAMNVVVINGQAVFLCDTYLNEEPSADELRQFASLAAGEIRRFGLEPVAAFLSHTPGSGLPGRSTIKMRTAIDLFRKRHPQLRAVCEEDAGSVLSAVAGGDVTSGANLLLLANLDAANIALGLLKSAAGNRVTVGPLLLGTRSPVNIITSSTSERGIVNIAAVTALRAAMPADLDRVA
ncbi:NADP-dependent malic enzyme [Ensifer sp. ENS07]|uniref:phosphate acyltransferase n=1 Tax=Ensifer sp. ENS07 TaxID=2769274 RepID=UPI00177FA0E9|nr:phosphate acyltransferase [Ensifer sp. ENS07]MBD9641758.1 NADP-dependent malic enzyme [Ensifer sp. ENS07]